MKFVFTPRSVKLLLLSRASHSYGVLDSTVQQKCFTDWHLDEMGHLGGGLPRINTNTTDAEEYFLGSSFPSLPPLSWICMMFLVHKC